MARRRTWILVAVALAASGAACSSDGQGGGSGGGAGGTSDPPSSTSTSTSTSPATGAGGQAAGEGGAGGGAIDEGGGGPGGGGDGTGGTPLGGGDPGTGGPPPDPFDGVAGCELEDVQEFPSELSPTDGCEATYACDEEVTLLIECDGENDGTGTSLCTCTIGDQHRYPDDVVDGEGEEACLAALDACLAG